LRDRERLTIITSTTHHLPNMQIALNERLPAFDRPRPPVGVGPACWWAMGS